MGRGRDECCTVIEKIKSVEESIKSCYFRVETLEKRLKQRHLTIEERNNLEKELEDVKTLLNNNEKQLNNLQTENTKSFLLAATTMFLMLLMYSVYMILK